MHPWIAERTTGFDSSGIRKVFDLARSLSDPIDLSIGQPDFPVPEPVQEAAIAAIRSGKNGYSPTQGIPELRDRLQAEAADRYGHADRKLFVAAGTGGALTLAMLALVNPGDEVVFLDPYFVMYPSLVKLAGGVPVAVDSYPDFRLDPDRIAAAITPRTKMILLNSPANPTGVTADPGAIRAVAELAATKNIALVSDEIYESFFYEGKFVSPAEFNDQTIVVNSFSKSHAATGWRLGFAHGPAAVIETMLKLQQFTFVCAPQPMQWAGLAALDVDSTPYRDDYRRKRDLLLDALGGALEVATPGGAFFLFPRAPGGSGQAFVERAIKEKSLLVIPGSVFSGRDTHFRISYAATDETLIRGAKALVELASEYKS